MATLFTENDLKDIVLKCPDENDSYPPPTTMYNEKGKKIYAYVTLVMMGDRYIPAAIVLAHSIRKLESKADLVVMITKDVSEAGKRILASFYDRIVNVKYLNVPNWRGQKQQKRKYLEYVFTKFNLFNLVQYKKVLLIDADALVLKHPDHLFTLNAPAGCFLKHKEWFIYYDEKGNYILPPNKKIQWYSEMCKNYGHGKILPAKFTDNVLKERTDIGIAGGLMLLEPDKDEYQNIIKDISKGKMRNIIEKHFVWPEQQYLTQRYSGRWTSINPVFFGLQGYPHWSVLFGLQYGGDKPFMLSSKIDISERIIYPDYILWHKFYGEILQEFPEYKKNPVLHEVNEMYKFFTIQVRRHKIKLSRTGSELNSLIDKIKEKLNISTVHTIHVDYYYLNVNLLYHPSLIRPMFENIKPYDYFRPIELLNKNNKKSSYYESLLKKKKYIGEYELNSILFDSNIEIEDCDEIMLEYIKSKPETFVITIWPIAQSIIDKLVEELKKHGNVYYIRTLSVSYRALKHLMFWMYNEFSFSERPRFIKNKLTKIGAQKYEMNTISFIIFDNVKGKRISGQGSQFKTFLRSYCLALLDNTDLHGEDILHINDYYHQTIQYSEMLLNQNTIDFLEQQNIKFKNMTEHQQNCYLRLQTFLKWQYLNLSLLEMSKIICIGSTILYAYGFRYPNDINAIMISPNSDDLEQLMYDNFQNEKTKFEFINIGIEGRFWKEQWTVENNDMMNHFNIEIFDDIVSDPRNHFYYQGLKLYKLEYELVRKALRMNHKDQKDFLIINKFNPEIIHSYVSIKNDKVVSLIKK